MFSNILLCLVFVGGSVATVNENANKQMKQIPISFENGSKNFTIYEDQQQQRRSIFVSPLAIYTPNQTEIIPDGILKNRYTLRITLQLYTDAQLNYVLNKYKNQCNNKKQKSCEFHHVPSRSMRIQYNDSYPIWLSDHQQSHPRTLALSIECRTNRTCLKLQNELPNLYLEFSVQYPTIKKIRITYNDLMKIKTYRRVKKFISELDMQELIDEILIQVNVKQNDEFYVSPIDEYLLRDMLHRKLFENANIFDNNTVWSDVYWNEQKNGPRPDRLLSKMRKRTTKITPSKKENATFDEAMDEHVKTTYDDSSYRFYEKNRKWFDFDEIEGKLEIKARLGYRLSPNFDLKSFLIEKNIHIIEQKATYKIPIRVLKTTSSPSSSDIPCEQKLNEVRQGLEKLLKLFNNRNTTTNERTLTTNNIEYNDETTTTETESSTTLSTDLSDEFTQGKTCGCAQWCRERGSKYGICGEGHTCFCNSHPISNTQPGVGCHCNTWCQERGRAGGICGDGYTCICGSV